ncbi:MAG: 3',5'-cyclic-nucleotide phosphodiesterase [Deltaproteobacteria bacterium]|nr:3',5'-cyclic-nucleotide phosphodiesterase [Deltaproteobacteria bacterium]
MKMKVLGSYGAEFPGFKTMGLLINDTVLVDAGSVTSSLSIEEQERISDILVTHSHLDHIKDILFLADNLAGRGKNHINIIATDEIISIIQGTFFNNMIWPDFTLIPTTSDPIIRFKKIKTEENIKIDHLTVKAVDVDHTVKGVGYFISDGNGAIMISGDTGPTDRIWQIANEKKDMKAIFIETSFPDNLERLAEISKHLTPHLLKEELKKLKRRDIPVYIVHMKPQYIDALKKEITEIGHPCIHFLEQGQELTF